MIFILRQPQVILPGTIPAHLHHTIYYLRALYLRILMRRPNRKEVVIDDEENDHVSKEALYAITSDDENHQPRIPIAPSEDTYDMTPSWEPTHSIEHINSNQIISSRSRSALAVENSDLNLHNSRHQVILPTENCHENTP